MNIFKNRTIVVWFSCGAASAVAAKKVIELYGKRWNIRVVNNPIYNEDEDNVRFLRDVEKWLGVKIEFALNSKYPKADCVEVWEDRKYMSGIGGAPCTMILKKEARQQWEANNPHNFMVLGFTSEETGRAKRFGRYERDNLLTPLIDLGISKKNCFEIIQEAGIELPRIYKLGYPNANCIGCVKATSPTYWNHVRKVHPEVFEQRAIQSRRIGARLVTVHPKYLPEMYELHNGVEWRDIFTHKTLHYKDKKTGKIKLKTPRIFLDELPINVKGKPMKDMDFECGIFCETEVPDSH